MTVTQEIKDLWYKIRLEEVNKTTTGISGAACVDDEVNSAIRFAEWYYQSKIDAVTDEMIKKKYSLAGVLPAEKNLAEIIYTANIEGAKWLKEKLKQ